MQKIKAYIKGEGGLHARALCTMLVLLLFPLVLVSPLIIHFVDRRGQRARLMWALAEWGSDHMPVTVCMKICTPVIKLDAAVCSCKKRRRDSSNARRFKLCRKSSLRRTPQKVCGGKWKLQKRRC